MAICQLVAQFPFVAMDTEFPGTIDNPNTQTHTWTQSTLDHPYRLGNIHRHRHGHGHRVHLTNLTDTDADRETDLDTETDMDTDVDMGTDIDI